LPVFVPLIALVPVTARVGVEEPERVIELTVVGVIAPRARVIAGVVVLVATVPETPFAAVTDTLVTVPLPPPTADKTPLLSVILVPAVTIAGTPLEFKPKRELAVLANMESVHEISFGALYGILISPAVLFIGKWPLITDIRYEGCN